ncbi:MAG: glycosyltransferase [Candidatus Azobacteroides sp.]|nr:glycosyltransferase [Candidatus Azobacteroides sp.]
MKYTIAIPAYKAKFLKECIDSILAQTYTDFELVIVNDASPENLEEIVGRYDDPRIRYYKNEKNCGAINVVDNWNKCLGYANGEYIILMGDDDKMMPDYLKEFNVLMKKYPDLDIYHCRSYIINENSEVIGITPSWPEYETVYESIWYRMNGFRLQFISDFVYKTQSLKERGGFKKFKLAWASDDVSAFMAAEEKGIAHTQSPVFCYRRSDITISSSGSGVQKLKAIKEEKEWYDNFVNQPTPASPFEKQLFSLIKNTYKKYIQKKRIETIAYHGINKQTSLRDLLFWNKTRKRNNMNSKEIIYAYILFLKKTYSK